MKRRYCLHVMYRTCMKHRKCLPCQRRERLCAAERLIQSYLSLLGFSNAITLQRHITTTAFGRRSCRTHENCVHAEQIITIFYIYIFCSMYLVLFSIVLYRTILIFTPTIFLYIIKNGKCIKSFIFHRWGVLPQPEVKPRKKKAR